MLPILILNKTKFNLHIMKTINLSHLNTGGHVFESGKTDGLAS